MPKPTRCVYVSGTSSANSIGQVVTNTPGQAIPTPCIYNMIHKLHSGMSCVQDGDSNISCVLIIWDNWIAECVAGGGGSGMSGDIED